MTTTASPQPGKRSSWLRKLMFGFGGLIVLLVAAYFVVTSSAFFKGVILPRASQAIGGEITVAEASISPFSQVTLRQLVVKTTGAEPLLQANEVRLRYSLTAILGGTLQVDEVMIDSPVVQIVANADGTSNLDPLLSQGEAPAAQPAPAAGQAPQIAMKNIALKNATVRRVQMLKDGGREVAELSGINITLDQLQNGQSGKLTSAAVFKYTRPTNDVLEAKSTGQLEFALGADLMPQSLNARLEQEIVRAEGSLSDMAGHRTLLTANVTPSEVKEFSQRFFKEQQLLGELKITGPLDLAKKEGRLKLEVASIDRQVLNLIGGPLGIDFGTTTLNATTEVSLTQGGSLIAATSQFNIGKFSLTQNGQTTPPMDLQIAYDVTVNTTDSTARLQTLALNGTQNQKPLLRGALTQPMTLAWGNAASTAGDSGFDLTVTNFAFADWKSVLGESVSAGNLSFDLKLVSQQGGKQLKLSLATLITDLSMPPGDMPMAPARLELKLNGQLNDFKKVAISDYRLDLTRQSQSALTLSGSAEYDGAAFNVQSQMETVMSRLVGSGPATPLALGLKLDGSFTNEVLDLRQLQVAFSPTARVPRNELNASGRIDLSTPGVTKGRLLVKSDTLDLTQLYDTFAGQPADTATATPPAGQPEPGTGDGGEPDAIQLPLQLTAEANLGQVYLHEIAITNLQTTVKVDGGRVTLDPFRLSLNGAPVSAGMDLDLGVKGYTYALSMKVDKVPLEPIANTFSPTTRGQYQGLILVNAQINGAGITGASLQKSLGGQVGFSFTNANLLLMGPKAKKLIVPIATVLRVNEITQTPLNWLDVQTDLGGGNIKISRFAMQGAAFDARMQGTIPIADVLTNSPLNLPMEFALSRNLAEKSNLLPPNTPTNAAYATLPQFVTIGGTLGEPKSEVNKLALGGMLLQSGTGIAEKLGVKVDPAVGNVLQGVGNLLGGQKKEPAKEEDKDAAPKPGLLDLFNKPKN